MANAAFTRVIKLGGSLLGWPGLRAALRRWRDVSPERCDLLVVGGGAAADWVREMDRAHGLGDSAAHRLAIEAMCLNTQFAAQLWPEARWCEDLSQLDRSAGLSLLMPWPALEDEQQRQFREPLPHAWDVTSDSIAAWVASAINADQLVLLKSALPPNAEMKMAIDAGYVDRHFEFAARDVPEIIAVNLRSEEFESMRLS
jgi:aspartokinase-like uncharacterized kinase